MEYLYKKMFEVIFWEPHLVAKSEESLDWLEHIPFSFFVLNLVKPKIFVELGVYTGNSYYAFCQAVASLRLDTKCYGVDTWKGDAHSGFYGKEVLETLREYLYAYRHFSTLMQMTFDEAVKNFSDKSIDLLHIDGLHTYESVKHDFETWLPEMSEKGVILFHDTNVKERNFGVWKLWEEISSLYPNFEFKHGYGLGVLLVGNNPSKELADFFNLDLEEKHFISNLFYWMGNRILLTNKMEQKKQLITNLQSKINYIYGLEGWKLYNKCYQIGEKILPLNSKRRKIAAKLLKTLNNLLKVEQ